MSISSSSVARRCQSSSPSAPRRPSRASSVMRTAITCPPSKPISTLLSALAMGSVLLCRLDDLGEHPVGRAGVQEGDAAVADAGPRRPVDQLDALLVELGERGLDVADRVGDVMQTGSLAGEELADR